MSRASRGSAGISGGVFREQAVFEPILAPVAGAALERQLTLLIIDELFPEPGAGAQTQIQLASCIMFGPAQPVAVESFVPEMLPLQLAKDTLGVLLRLNLP